MRIPPPFPTALRWLGALLLVQLCFATAKAQDTTSPKLSTVSPVRNATGVPVNSPVVFTFSEAMQVPTDYSMAISWSGDGIDGGNMGYAWSGGGTTLTCTYAGGFPANTQVVWNMIPGFPGFPTGAFSDLAGNPIQFDPGNPLALSGFFTTAGGGGTNDCGGTGTNANVTLFSLSKYATFEQTNAGPSTPSPSTEAFISSASVNLATGRTADDITLTKPGGSPESMDFFGQYLVFDQADNQAGMDAAFPVGTYTFNVTGSPSQVVNANLPANTLPNAPHLSNFTAAQTINAGANFTLTWDPFIGGPPEEVIGVEIKDSLNRVVFELTNAAGCPRFLPGTATSVVIPGGTLSSNQNYTLELMFLHPVSTVTNASPPSLTMVNGYSTTTIPISTNPGGVVPPPSMVLTNLALLPSGAVQFQFPTAPGTVYTVEYTGSLESPTSWTTLVSSNAAGASIQVIDLPPPGTATRFYRARHN